MKYRTSDYIKKTFACFCFGIFVLSCNIGKQKTPAASAGVDSTNISADNLPYTASYSSSFTTNVPDADVKMVLMSYKDWADGNMSRVASAMGDSVTVEMYSGDRLEATNAGLMKRWGRFRDSLSCVKIDMTGWQKMYAVDKKEAFVVTWYDETDTYKNGKVDSASYHDINQVKNGKITWYSQYKRRKK